jgi:2-C-methyl-D-erythritol 4-phosphate cytidylyltransferase
VTDGGPGDAAALLAAGGAGVRLGPGAPKALRLLGGEPLLVHVVRRLAQAGSVGYVVVAVPPGREAEVRRLLGSAGLLHGGRPGSPPSGPPPSGLPPLSWHSERTVWPRVTVVAGGPQRQRSVAAALAVVPAGFDIVLVHDAARALAPPSLVDEVAAAVRSGHDAVVPVRPVPDTITQVGPAGEVIGSPDRSTLRAVQTPQGFRRRVLREAHAAATDGSATDDAGLVARLGVPVRTIPGSERAMKITTRYDLLLAELLLTGGQD